MLTLILDSLGEIDESQLARTLADADGQLRLIIRIPHLYHGPSAANVAHAALLVWYIAELLADHGTNPSITEAEDDAGEGLIRFDMDVDSCAQLTSQLASLAAALDPETFDDGTAYFELGAAATDWYEERGHASNRFPELKEAYLIELTDVQDSGDALDSVED